MTPLEVLKRFTALQWEAAVPDCVDDPSIRQLKRKNLLRALHVKRELLAAAEAAEAARRLSARRRLGADSDADVHTPPTQRVPGPGVRSGARPPAGAATAAAPPGPEGPGSRFASDNADPIVTTAGPKHAALTAQGLAVSTGLDKRRRGGEADLARLLSSARPAPEAAAAAATQDGWRQRAPREAERPAAARRAAAAAGAGAAPPRGRQRSLMGTRSRKQRERDVAARVAAASHQHTQEAARAAEAAGKQPAEEEKAERLQKRKQEGHESGEEGEEDEEEGADDPIMASPTQLPPGGMAPRGAVLDSPAAKRPRLEDLEAIPASDSLPEEGTTPGIGGSGGSGAGGATGPAAPDWSLGELVAPRSTPSAAAGGGGGPRLPATAAVAAALRRLTTRGGRGAVPPPPRFDVDSVPETPEALHNISETENGAAGDRLRGIGVPATLEALDSGGALPGVIFGGSGGAAGPADEATPAAALRGYMPSSEVAEGRRSRLGGGGGGGGGRRTGLGRRAALLAADAVPETEVEPVTVARPVPAIAMAAGGTAAAGTSGRRLAAPQSVLPALRAFSPALRLAGSLPASFSLRFKLPLAPGGGAEATPAVAPAPDGAVPPPAAPPPESLPRFEAKVRALPLAAPGQPSALRLRLPQPALAAAASADGRHLAVLMGTEVTWEPTEVVVFAVSLESKEASEAGDGDAAAVAAGDDDSQAPAAARVVASVPVQRSRHAVGMPVTPSALALGATPAGDPVLLLSAIFELAEGPLTSERPTLHAVVCAPGAGVLGVETDDPLFALALTGPRSLVAAGYGALGAVALEFDASWRSYIWGRPLPAPPGAGLPPAVAATSGASGAGLDDVCSLVRCVEGPADGAADKSEGAVLLGLTATGLAGTWDAAARAGLAAGGSETWALRAAVPLGAVAGVAGAAGDSPCFAALLQLRDGGDATAVALAALAPGAGLALGAPLPLDGYVTALGALRPGGPVLLGCSDGGVRVWAPGSGACSAPLAACGSAVTAFAAAPGAGVVAVVSIGGEVAVMAAAQLEAAACGGSAAAEEPGDQAPAS